MGQAVLVSTFSPQLLSWLLDATTALRACKSATAALNVAYDAIRDGLGYERIDLLLVDAEGSTPRGGIVTGAKGHKRSCSALGLSPERRQILRRLSTDIRLQPAGSGFVFLDGPMPALLIALRSSTAVLGAILVEARSEDRLIHSTVPPLMVLAAGLAGTLENAALLERSDRLAHRVVELEWLRDMNHHVNTAETLDAVLDSVYQGLRAGQLYDRVGIWLLDACALVLEECRGTDIEGSMTGPLDRTIALQDMSAAERIPGLLAVARGGAASYLSEVPAPDENDPWLFPGLPAQHLLVALRTGESVIGLIVADRAISQRAISTDEVDVLHGLSTQVSAVLQNLRLREHERAEHRRLTLLLESTRILSSSVDGEQILHDLAERLVTALDASSAVFSSIDRGDDAYLPVVPHPRNGGPHRDYAERGASVRAFPILEQVVQTSIPFRGHIGDPDLPVGEQAYLRHHGLLAELIVPVLMRGEITGMLEIHWDRLVYISAETVMLCSMIAEQAAVALSNARLHADATERADRDMLTGLLNHSTLLEHIDSAIQACDPFAVVLLDIDNFKLFNDTHGYASGDAVLTWVAGVLRGTCRDGDVAGRYGGDEMAVVLRGTMAAEASAVAYRMAAAIHARPHITPEATIIPITVSTGIACYPSDGATRSALIAVADAARHAARRRSVLLNSSRDAIRTIPSWQNAHLRDAADLLGDSPFGVLEGLVTAVDVKDRYTREHSEHVTYLALLLADALGLQDEQRRVLTVAGLLHDVGKIGVPDRVLRKPGPLSEDEQVAIRLHVAYGVAIIRGVLDDMAVVDAVTYHHERWDGHGYPHAATGPATPLLGRIMQVADAASAMLLDRPYRQGLSWSEVAARLRSGAGSQFDPALVDPFLIAFERVQQRLVP